MSAVVADAVRWSLQWLDGSTAAGTIAWLLVETSLALAGALLVARMLRRRSARVRHLVYCAGLIAAGALPLLAVALPERGLAVLPTNVAPTPTLAPAVAVRSWPRPRPEPRPGPLPAAAPTTVEATRLEPWIALALLWLVPSAGLLARLGIGLCAAERARRASELATAPTRDLWLHGREPHRGSPPEVRLSADSRVPTTFGWWRQVILLPAEARAWPDRQRRAVLLHELAHVERLDWPVLIAARVICALHWFNPLAWSVVRRLELEAEQAADDRVLLDGTDPADYAAELVAQARKVFAPTAFAGAAVGMAGPRPLEARIASILDPDRRRSTMKRPQLLVVIGATLAVSLHLAPLRLLPGASALVGVASAHSQPSLPSQETGASQQSAETAPTLALLDEWTEADESEAVDDWTDLAASVQDASSDETRPTWHRDERPRSPLGVAARSGRLSAVIELLDAGAKPDVQIRGDASPLMMAAEHGHLAVATALLDRGADPNRVVAGDGSPLIAAVRGGHPLLVSLLLDRGADPNLAVDGDGSPLIAAVESGQDAIVRQLVARGADPNRRVDGDGAPMVHAAERGDLTSLRALIVTGGDVDLAMDGDGTPLIAAARSGSLETAQELLEHGADIDRASPGDGNPLIMAAAAGNLAMVKLLLDRGADIERVVAGDENPLIGAAEGGHLEVVRLLLDRGANANAVVEVDTWRGLRERRTPLSMARRGGHRGVVELLLERGARD